MGARSTNFGKAVSQSARFVDEGLLLSPGGVKSVTFASGGTKSTPGDGYVYHYFTSSGSLNVATIGEGEAGKFLYFAVGGGGAGGYDRGGGGGGGAVTFTTTAQPLVTGNHTITVGAGGVGPQTSSNTRKSGQDTTIGVPTTPVTANGGGGGGSDGPGYDQGVGVSKASGGGGHRDANGGPSSGSPNSGDGPYGNPGYKGNQPGWPSGGGGGGGAGQGGPTTQESPTNAIGGYGAGMDVCPWIAPVVSPLSLGEDGYFGGGGGMGGSPAGQAPRNPSGKKGGGAAGNYGGSQENGLANTGGGGGGGTGGGPDVYGGSGGSGMVLIRYPTG